VRALVALCLATSLAAQTPATDSAAVARAAVQRALAATRAGAADLAWRELQRAASAWPVQPAYVERLAMVAAARADSTVLLHSIRVLTRMQSADRILQDSTTRERGRALPTVQAALDDLAAAVADVTNSEAETVYDDSLFFAEGLRTDSQSGVRYVTSVHRRNVLRLGAQGSSSLLIDSTIARGAVLGVAPSPDGQSIWVTTTSLPRLAPEQPPSTKAELLRLHALDGRLLGRWLLGDGTGTPGEIAVTSAGEVLVSDGTRGLLYRLPVGAPVVRTVRHPLLRSPQGIALSSDARTAWIADWTIGLLRWELSTDSITRLAEPSGGTLLGIDGLARHSSWLIGVQNGLSPARIVGIELDAAGASIRQIRTLDRQRYEGEPTVGTVEGDLYQFVASSHWPFYNDDGRRRVGSALPPVVLRRLRLTF
jgi:hypothetical protein